MHDIQWEGIFSHAKGWIREAGNLIKQSFYHEVTIQFKTNFSDLVTNIDKQVEQFFIEKIHLTYSDHRVLGEEGYGDNIDSSDGIVWIIDPIDGTTNFVNQQRHFAISVAVYHNGVGKIGLIYDVASDELYHCMKGKGAYLDDKKLPQLKEKKLSQSLVGLNATWVTKNRRIDPEVLAPLVNAARGIRSYGSAAIEIAYIASGRLDCYISMRLAPWDIAAGMVMIQEVGGKMTKIDGKPIDIFGQNTVFVANPFVHDEILQQYILPKLNELKK